VDPLELELPELELPELELPELELLELELPELELLEALVLAPVTTIEKAGSANVVVPSVAARIIRSLLAVSAAARLPEGWLVVELKVTGMMMLS
jgi:hypothetical protein